MRELSFKGFLEQYATGLSEAQSGVNVRRLAREAEDAPNYRLLAPLMLLAFLTGRLDLVRKEAAPGKSLAAELERLSAFHDADELLAALDEPDWSGDGRLPLEYYKVWEAYSAARGRFDDQGAKESLRQRALSRQAESGFTTYRAATDLGLNRGAVWDFLARGNMAALTRDDARRVAEYMKGGQGPSC